MDLWSNRSGSHRVTQSHSHSRPLFFPLALSDCIIVVLQGAAPRGIQETEDEQKCSDNDDGEGFLIYKEFPSKNKNVAVFCLIEIVYYYIVISATFDVSMNLSPNFSLLTNHQHCCIPLMSNRDQQVS